MARILLRPLRILAVVLPLLAGAATTSAASDPDSLYIASHPSLLFDLSNLSGMKARVQAQGPPGSAFTFIRNQYLNVYISSPFDSLLGNDGGQEPVVNLGLAGYLVDPLDTNALTLGRDFTLWVARNFNVDNDAYLSALRLRTLAIGYDLFFSFATSAERAEIRAEATSYLSVMNTQTTYDIWLLRPYVSNKSAMVAASLGLAAIAFANEISPTLTADAFARSDALYQAWRSAHLEDGCYREGAMYGLWSMRNLIYYFHARKRYDGTVYSNDWALREFERWIAYEFDPRGQARLNNMNDQTDALKPLGRHTTYFDWAMWEWGSQLSRYLWDRSAGPFGVDMLDENDKAATVFWYVPVLAINPGTILPKSDVWLARGLYYYRSGWPAAGSSDDIVFSFYSGEFRGGHAQEDQNQITLAAFGEKLLLDHGAGSVAKQSEAHNIVRVDQLGQHNAGSSIGTDGRIVKSIITNFADYVCGDATAAYNTYSPYNAPDVPLPGTDWSWGYDGGNPVEHALRRAIVVHAAGFPTYVIVQDDIKKDGAVHRYDWCAHLPDHATVSLGTAAEPVRATAGNARLDVHVLYPPKATLTGVQVLSFDNESEDPESKLLMLTSFAVNPKFTMLLMPTRTSDSPPVVSSAVFAAGTVSTVVLPGGVVDVVWARRPQMGLAAQTPDAAMPEIEGCGSLAIDAELAVVRMTNGAVARYLAVDNQRLACSSGDIAVIYDGPATVAFDGSLVYIDRADAEFRILADGVDNVVCNGVVVPTQLVGRYLVNAATYATDPPSAGGVKELRAYPNPFNPSVQIAFTTTSPARVEARIYDPAGRLVTTLESGMLPAGEHTVTWNGNDADGRPVASGVYFLRVRSASQESSLKLVLVR